MPQSTTPLVSYKPSAYYFRTGLRGAKTRADAEAVIRVVASEQRCLTMWVRAKGLMPPATEQASAAKNSKAAVIEHGLSAVNQLEDLKTWVRAQGLIPPKFAVLAIEAKAKGWTGAA